MKDIDFNSKLAKIQNVHTLDIYNAIVYYQGTVAILTSKGPKRIESSLTSDDEITIALHNLDWPSVQDSYPCIYLTNSMQIKDARGLIQHYIDTFERR